MFQWHNFISYMIEPCLVIKHTLWMISMVTIKVVQHIPIEKNGHPWGYWWFLLPCVIPCFSETHCLGRCVFPSVFTCVFLCCSFHYCSTSCSFPVQIIFTHCSYSPIPFYPFLFACSPSPFHIPVPLYVSLCAVLCVSLCDSMCVSLYVSLLFPSCLILV